VNAETSGCDRIATRVFDFSDSIRPTQTTFSSAVTLSGTNDFSAKSATVANRFEFTRHRRTGTISASIQNPAHLLVQLELCCYWIAMTTGNG